MTKRMQELKGEERIVATSKPEAMNLSSTVSASSSSAKDPIASKGLVKLIASGKPDARRRRSSKPHGVSRFQVRLQDAYLGGLMDKVAGKLAATDESQELWEFSESESWSSHEKEVTGKLVAHEEVTGKLVASRNSENSGNPKVGSRKWPHNFHMPSAVVSYMEKVYSIVRKIYDRSFTDNLDDLDVNTDICFFMNTTLQASVHLVETLSRIFDLPRINS